MKTRDFVHAVVTIIDDDSAVHKASKKDLAIIEGILAGVQEVVSKELKRRDTLEEPAASVKLKDEEALRFYGWQMQGIVRALVEILREREQTPTTQEAIATAEALLRTEL